MGRDQAPTLHAISNLRQRQGPELGLTRVFMEPVRLTLNTMGERFQGLGDASRRRGANNRGVWVGLDPVFFVLARARHAERGTAANSWLACTRLILDLAHVLPAVVL